MVGRHEALAAPASAAHHISLLRMRNGNACPVCGLPGREGGQDRNV